MAFLSFHSRLSPCAWRGNLLREFWLLNAGQCHASICFKWRRLVLWEWSLSPECSSGYQRALRKVTQSFHFYLWRLNGSRFSSQATTSKQQIPFFHSSIYQWMHINTPKRFGGLAWLLLDCLCLGFLSIRLGNWFSWSRLGANLLCTGLG